MPSRCPLGIGVTTYAELEKIVQAFTDGHFNLLILLGSHGLGKSRIVRQALPGPSRWPSCPGLKKLEEQADFLQHGAGGSQKGLLVLLEVPGGSEN